MGLDDSVEESVCSSSNTLLAVPPAEEPGGHQGELCEDEEEDEDEEVQVQVSRVLWCYCLQVKEEVEQKEACLVLTDRLLGLLYLSDDVTWTNQDAGKHTIRLSCLYTNKFLLLFFYLCLNGLCFATHCGLNEFI